LTQQRLDACFARCKAEGRAAFIAYVMAGDPDLATALEIIKGLPGAGADIIEVGMPFSDPMAEGPPIQRAAQRSLKAGTTASAVLDTVRAFRQGDTDTPIVLMGYLNPVLSRGYTRFAREAAEAGVDGLIIVDAPPEDSEDLDAALKAEAISRIWLAAPTTDDERLKALVKGASGFVYYVSVAGVTGVKEADADAVRPAVERVRAASGLPVAVGFGIKTPERAAAVALVADAVVVGSALVEQIAVALEANQPPAPKVLASVRALAQAVRDSRRQDATVQA
jgi:tryptophan synthase alpha chain